MNKNVEKRILERRNKVLNYINTHRNDVLHFYITPGIYMENLSIELPLIEIILKILYLSEYCWSENTDNAIETLPRKWRSSLDIWRHVKYFRPDVTIFEVMECLWHHRDKFSGHYCNVICRRVFRLRCYGYLTKDQYDEYKICFKSWGSINFMEKKNNG